MPVCGAGGSASGGSYYTYDAEAVRPGHPVHVIRFPAQGTMNGRKASHVACYVLSSAAT